jgi:outer membrane protein TolC
LSWTFPFLRKNQGEVAKANAEELRASTLEASYRVVLRTSVDGTVRSLRTLTQALAELDTNGLVAMEKVLEAAKEGYKLGKVELFRVLAARRDLVLARTRRLDVLDAVWRATGELTVLSGGDLP